VGPARSWSNEHRAWWGPDDSSYSPGLNNADHYSRNEADILRGRPVPEVVANVRVTNIFSLSAITMSPWLHPLSHLQFLHFSV